MTRLDMLLVEKGLTETREQARRLILAGEVFVGGHVVDKPGRKVAADAELRVREKCPYVGRGGVKLAGALDAFGMDVAGRVCMDVGASTGGFTDCLLQHGAARVYCFDVGTNQLAWKIRSDARVVAREKFNARNLRPDDVGEPVDLAVADLSFISLTKVLPAVFGVMRPGGELVVLIKPQFELTRDEVGRGGIVACDEARQRAVEKIRVFVRESGNLWHNVVASPIAGSDGNQEYFAWIALP